MPDSAGRLGASQQTPPFRMPRLPRYPRRAGAELPGAREVRQPAVSATEFDHLLAAEAHQPAQRSEVASSGPSTLSLRDRGVRLHGRAASAELLRLPARVLEPRAGVGVDVLTGLDSLKRVPLQQLRVRCFQQRPGYSARSRGRLVGSVEPLGARGCKAGNQSDKRGAGLLRRGRGRLDLVGMR
jgi:hypothetical protein